MRLGAFLFTAFILILILIAIPCLPSGEAQTVPPTVSLFFPVAVCSLPTLTPTPTSTPDFPLWPEDEPIPIFPNDGSHLSTIAPEFTWRSVEGQSRYELQIAADSGFSTAVVSMSPYAFAGVREYTNRLPSNLTPATRYYWRVGYQQPNGQWRWSEVWSFITAEPGGPIPPAPLLAAPRNGVTVPSLFPRLEWQFISGTTIYCVYVGAPGTSSQFNLLTPASNATPPMALLSDWVYSWRVRARNEYAWGDESETWAFSTPRSAPVGDLSELMGIATAGVRTYSLRLPLVIKWPACLSIPGESYATLSVNASPAQGFVEINPDFNLAMRSYVHTNAYRGLVDYDGGHDPGAPQFPGLFSDRRTATFAAVYQVHDWDWRRDARGPLLTNPPVTLAGLATTPGETIHVPDSGYTIGDGYEVLVLYAEPERITLKYTREDDVVYGYTLHVENVCVEPGLLALYQACDQDGRGYLPTLRAGQAFARARGTEIGVAIRDCGTFLDPRSRKDWWQGR